MLPHHDGIAPVQSIAMDRRVSGVPDTGRLPDAEGRLPVAGKPEGRQAGYAGSVAGELRAQLQAQDARLTFETDRDSGKLVVRLKDSSGRVIRQIPPDEMLRLARSIDRYLGLLVDRHS
ncbi:MAG: flagellar protein FlaG [Chloroflexota bacterium]